MRARVVLGLVDGSSVSAIARQVGRQRPIVRKCVDRLARMRLQGLDDALRAGTRPGFLPAVAMYLVKLSCELPDDRSLSLWTCT